MARKKSLALAQITLDTPPSPDYSFPADVDGIKRRFKELAKTLHPDAGGTTEEFLALTAARDAALSEQEEDFCSMMGMTEEGT